MTTDIRPGQQVLALRLPIPVDGLTYVNEFIDRVYGSGNTTMRGDGSQVTIAAPADGFGPVVRDPMPPLTRDAGDDLIVTELNTRQDPIIWDMESAGGALGVIVQSQLAFLDLVGAKNYISTGLRVGDEFVRVVVQRDGKPTPHELRLEAEEREASLRDALERVRDALHAGDTARAAEVITATL